MRRVGLSVVLVFVIGALVRLLIALTAPPVSDIHSYQTVSTLVRSGANIYAENAPYNYAPTWSFVLALFSPAQMPVGIRLLLIGADALMALVVGRLGGQRAMLLYWLSPGVIVFAIYGGQFEVLALLPLGVAAWLFSHRH